MTWPIYNLSICCFSLQFWCQEFGTSTHPYKKKKHNKTHQHAKPCLLSKRRHERKHEQCLTSFSKSTLGHMQTWHDKLKPNNSCHNRKALYKKPIHFTVGTTMFLTMFDVKHKKIWSPENTAPKKNKRKCCKKSLKAGTVRWTSNGTRSFTRNYNKIPKIKNDLYFTEAAIFTS